MQNTYLRANTSRKEDVDIVAYTYLGRWRSEEVKGGGGGGGRGGGLRGCLKKSSDLFVFNNRNIYVNALIFTWDKSTPLDLLEMSCGSMEMWGHIFFSNPSQNYQNLT